MKKNQIMAAVSLIALSFTAKPLKQTPAPCSYEQIGTDEKIDLITTVNYRDNLGVTTSDASPKLNKAHGYVSASALLMNILTDAQDVALYTYQNTSVTPQTQSNYYQNNNWGWNWGVKGALGFRVCDDGWDLSFNFAYLQATKRQNNQARSGSPTKTIYPLSGNLTTLSFNNRYYSTQSNQSAFNSFNLRNNFIIYDSNIDLAREFFVSKKLSLKPLAGVKGTLIEQNALINFVNGTSANQAGTFTNKNNYWGVGPQAGAGIRFGFTRYMSFNCQVDAALLWGHILNKETCSNYTAAVSPVALNTTYYANRYQLVPNFNIYAGFVFDTNCCNNTKNISFNIGYENRYFLNSIDSANTVTRAKGSTSLQGVTAGLSYSY